MGKSVALIFLGLGVASFLLATSFLTRTSESALMGGAMGLVPFGVGSAGAFLGRASVPRALGFGALFTVGSFIGQIT